jgi:hypothetical protein
MIFREIYKMSAKAGACREERRKLRNAKNKEDLLDMYLDNIKFCMVYNFPSAKYIKNNMRKLGETANIFVDKEITLKDPEQVILLGQCIAHVELSGSTNCRIYIKNDSVLKITLHNTSKAIIDMFDSSRVMADAHDDSKVYAFSVSGGKISRVTDQHVKHYSVELQHYLKGREDGKL